MKPSPHETSDEKDKRLSLERKSAELGRLLAARLPPGHGFALLLFNFGDKGYRAYISNAERADMVKAIREWLAREEGRS